MSVLDIIEGFFENDCYFRVHWGVYCPGCGGTRALVALGEGDIIHSLKYNPILVFFIANVILITVLRLVEKKGGYSTSKIRIIVSISFLLFIVIFSLLRNHILYAWGIDMLGDFS